MSTGAFGRLFLEHAMSQKITPGQEIVLGGETYILPPIPLVHMHLMAKLRQGGSYMEDPEYAKNLVHVIHTSLLRNYPDLEPAVVETNVDITNVADIVNRFRIVNGMQAVPAGEQAAVS